MRRRSPPDPLRVTRTRGTRPTCRSATGDGTRAGAPITPPRIRRSRHRRERRARALFRPHQIPPDRVAADDERMGPSRLARRQRGQFGHRAVEAGVIGDQHAAPAAAASWRKRAQTTNYELRGSSFEPNPAHEPRTQHRTRRTVRLTSASACTRACSARRTPPRSPSAFPRASDADESPVSGLPPSPPSRWRARLRR